MLKADLPALTGIRALAAIWVISLHFQDVWEILFPPLVLVRPLIAAGNYGVDLFFLLSGLIMMHVYAAVRPFRWRDYRDFLGRRLARIYPAYLAAFFFMIGLVLAANFAGVPMSTEMYPPSSLWREAFMLQAWGAPVLSWNYPAWSVSAEWFAYLAVFPLALLCHHRLGDLSPLRRAFTAIVIIFGAIATLRLATPDGDLPHALIRVSTEFFAGAMLYHLLRALCGHPRLADALVMFSILLLGLACWFPAGTMGTGILTLSSLVFGLLGLGESRSLSARVLAASPWVYLGTISYSLYLIHAPMQRILKVVLPVERFAESSIGLRCAVFAVHLCALFLAAACLYHFVEDPARRYFVTRLSRRKSAGAPCNSSGG
ncbi:peptidoglycan/LPS O-acetylase OafA/YrhL [Terrimicrobium sacchariphilum]|uniref:Peptidoglycan/LPS O-acetylase OafA/YrhL n=1 Tax=Terrimicrobium sacchariphilum TaxID=690879 RepID=A0A146GEI0_TERSA|nr:acyltransferase [Terrimicrobium sacchariphilum]GAT35532.1 peptidoglycan/LPS O-acetylase OafA/YrhL [Terrimicrobium sacchariphilum]